MRHSEHIVQTSEWDAMENPTEEARIDLFRIWSQEMQEVGECMFRHVGLDPRSQRIVKRFREEYE